MTTASLPISSTRAPALRVLGASLAIGVPTGLLFGTLECYAHTIPHQLLMIPTEILITLTFATTLGLLLVRLFRNLPSSSKSLTRLCTLAACAIAYYTAWIGWIANFVIYFSHKTPLLTFFLPNRVLDIASALNYLGTWRLFQKPAHGPLLTCVWFAELFALFTITTRLMEWKSKPRSNV